MNYQQRPQAFMFKGGYSKLTGNKAEDPDIFDCPEASAFDAEAVFSTSWRLVELESSFDCSLMMAPANTSDTNCLDTSFSCVKHEENRGTLITNQMHIEQNFTNNNRRTYSKPYVLLHSG